MGTAAVDPAVFDASLAGGLLPRFLGFSPDLWQVVRGHKRRNDTSHGTHGGAVVAATYSVGVEGGSDTRAQSTRYGAPTAGRRSVFLIAASSSTRPAGTDPVD